MMLRKLALLSCVVLSGCAGNAPDASDPQTWVWEFVRSGVPNFEDVSNNELVVVGVRFRNQLETDQSLAVAHSTITATTLDGEPIPIEGLLFNSQSIQSVKMMSGNVTRENTEMLYQVRDTMRFPFVKTRGPVEIVVGGQRSYVQGLILVRPPGQTKARLRFGSLPELEIELPNVAPIQ